MSIASLVERVSFRDSDHSYHLDGKRVPSVTTILANLSKPGLPSWAANTGATAVRERVIEISQEKMISPDDMWASSDFECLADELYELARTAHHRKKNTAAAKGNVVHGAIQKYHESFFEAEPPDVITAPNAFHAWEAFLAWWATADLTCIDTERKIVDPDGRYAGRLDMLCRGTWYPAEGLPIPDALFVIDIKTSNGIYPEHIYQNAAYANAIEKELDEGVFGTKVIWLPEGCTKATIVERDVDEWMHDFEMFEHMWHIHGHRRGLNKWLMDIKAEHGPPKAE